jgi:MinD superfamily P-loop ATPase
LEVLTKEEALNSYRDHELEGCVHTIFTAPAPFVDGLCNCDRSDCGPMKSLFAGEPKQLYKADYVAEVNPELCNGCRQCMRLCQFGAIGSSATQKKAFVDSRICAGCGICRSVCANEAITLKDRFTSPLAAEAWNK